MVLDAALVPPDAFAVATTKSLQYWAHTLGASPNGSMKQEVQMSGVAWRWRSSPARWRALRGGGATVPHGGGGGGGGGCVRRPS